MISIIFNFNPTRNLREDERFQLFDERFDFVDRIPEMRNVAGAIPLQAVVPSLAGMGRVKNLLDSLDQRGAIVIIGVWRTATDIEGNEILEQHPNYPFNLAVYKSHLRNIVTYDANGAEIGSRRPTDAEARAMQINKFMGMPDRILT